MACFIYGVGCLLVLCLIVLSCLINVAASGLSCLLFTGVLLLVIDCPLYCWLLLILLTCFVFELSPIGLLVRLLVGGLFALSLQLKLFDLIVMLFCIGIWRLLMMCLPLMFAVS